MDDQVTFLHPCKGVRTPPVPRKPLQIITPEQFDQIYRALPVADYQLLVETEIESGLRWGELTERRVKDLDGTRVLTVSRAVVEVNPKYHPTQGRFLVKDYVGEPSGLLQLQDEHRAPGCWPTRALSQPKRRQQRPGNLLHRPEPTLRPPPASATRSRTEPSSAPRSPCGLPGTDSGCAATTCTPGAASTPCSCRSC